MLVRMRTLAAGPGLNAQPGQVVDVGEAQGSGLVAGGYADLVEVAAVSRVDVEATVAAPAAVPPRPDPLPVAEPGPGLDPDPAPEPDAAPHAKAKHRKGHR